MADVTKVMKQPMMIAAVALRVMALVTLFTGPVYAVTMMQAGQHGAASGAGLVLYVSLERN
jgi:hypothetical protein